MANSASPPDAHEYSSDRLLVVGPITCYSVGGKPLACISITVSVGEISQARTHVSLSSLG